MVIEVTRSGGYAGTSERLARVDTSQLGSTVAGTVEELVARSHFFAQPAEVAGEVGTDLFRYEVTVHDGGRSHTVAFYDAGDLTSGPVAQLARAAVQSA